MHLLIVLNSTVHFLGRLQLHFRGDPRHFRRHHRPMFPRHHHWAILVARTRSLDLPLGERGNGES
jgi:hypothetical protein